MEMGKYLGTYEKFFSLYTVLRAQSRGNLSLSFRQNSPNLHCERRFERKMGQVLVYDFNRRQGH
jgi:hypothetical protein